MRSVAALACLIALACTTAADVHRQRGLRLAAEGRLPDAIAALREAVRRDPADARARVALGRLERDAGRPGAALRHLAAARELGRREVSRELAALYAERGRARARLGHRERWRDVERALALDRALAPSLEEDRRQALLDGALARWAAGDRRGARELGRRLPGGGADVAAALETPDAADLTYLGALATRLHRVGGGRAARPLLEAYARRGGADAGVRALAARVEREAAAEDVLEAGAPEPGDAPGRLARRARPLAPPDAVADAIAAALLDWLAGGRDAFVDDELVAFVEREMAGRDIAELPPWARPTVLRIRGEARAAADALRDVPAGLPPHAAVVVAFERRASGEGGELAAEPLATLAADGAPAWVWLAQVSLARGGERERDALARLALGDEEAAAALARRLDVAALLVAPARGGGAEVAARARGAAARWRRIAAPLGPEAAAPTLARWRAVAGDDAFAAWSDVAATGAAAAELGAEPRRPLLAPPGCAASAALDAELARVQRAYLIDAAAADALARDFVDGDPVPHCRGGAVLRMYARARDVGRALAWADELLALEPGDAEVLGLAVAVAAASPSAPRAAYDLRRAEYWARARGAPSLAAVDAFAAAGLPVEAIAAGRQALALADGRRRWDAYEALVGAALLAGREADARAAFAAYLAELPPRLRDDARRRVRAWLEELDAPEAARVAWLRPERPGTRGRALAAGGEALARWVAAAPDDARAAVALARERAAAGDDAGAAAALERALAWSPWGIEALAARAELAAAGSPERREALARLLLLGLVDDGERAAAALAAFVPLAERDGLAELAAGARRELALLLP